MRLKQKVWLLTIAVVTLIMVMDVVLGILASEARIRTELLRNAKDVRAILMATRRVYHKQFLASGLALDDHTIGFLPAHALSRISKDFTNWTGSGLRFNNVSDRPRNPDNKADRFDLQAMAWFRAHPQSDEHLVQIESDGREFYHFTSPIWAEPYCLKCHGSPEQAPESIRKHYSTAFGYHSGDLRGVMSIRLPVETLRANALREWMSPFLARLAGYGLLVVLLGGTLNRVVTVRLAHLEQTAGHLAGGDYTARCNTTGHDEVSALAQAFNRMAGDIQGRELALQESEARYRVASESMRDALILIGSDDGRVVWWNRAAEAVFGYARDEVIGRPVLNLIVPSGQRGAMANGLKGFSATGTGPIIGKTMEVVARHKDGHAVPVELSLAAVQFAGQWNAVGVARDITERRRAESAMRKNEERLRYLIKEMPIGGCLVDDTGRIYFRNRHFLNLFGYSEEEVPTLAEWWPTAYPDPEYREWVLKTWNSAVEAAAEAGSDIEPIEYRVTCKDGTVRDVVISGITFDRHFLATFVDMTARRQAETELQSYRNHLEELVAIRTSELAKAKEAADTANRAKSIFLANMSHELRTPLNAILGFAQIMARDTRIPEDRRRNIATINRSGSHLLALINDVLAISRIEAGRTRITKEAFNLPTLLAAVEEMTSVRAKDKGLSFVVQHPDDSAQYVEGDIHHLRQVLVNLLSNAIKYTDRGEVRLTVTALPGGVFRFVVNDTGPGIAREEQERIFDAFYQTENGVAKGEGTGLGLAISRELVRLMDGDITVASEPGRGSRFSFDIPLPAADSTPRAVSAPPVVGLEAGQPAPRILVAEDNPDNREVVEQMLVQVGLEVRVAPDGRQALELFRIWHPQLVLMDMRMPEMDGYAATRAIRALPEGEKVPIVALTASVFEEDRQQVRSAGCDEIVKKPVDEASLMEVIGRRLGLRFVREQAASDHPAAGGDLAALDAATRRKLADAAVVLDKEAIMEIATRLGGDHPAEAALVAELVDGYSFDRLQELCN